MALPRHIFWNFFKDWGRPPGKTKGKLKHAPPNNHFFFGGGVWVLSSTTSPYLMVDRPSYRL